jgi:hypothetical protein
MKNIHESVSKLLNIKLEKYKNEKLNSSTCISVYQEIFETFVDIFQESKIEITNEAMNLICQMYYDAITINGNQELDPSIFSQRATTKNIETKELAMLATLFSNTPFATPVILEIKRRS